MKRFFSFARVISFFIALFLADAPGARAQDGTPAPPCVEPFCIEFHEGKDVGNFSGYLPCQFPNPGVTLTIGSPGASGAATDFYLHARDLSGASLIQNFKDFSGDWTCLARTRCAEFCFDFKLFIDGDNNGSLNITPSFVIHSDPDGPCGATPPLRAQFVANFSVTENGGTNSGWHKVCAPIALWNGTGPLPTNSAGAWFMLDGAPNSSFNTLLSNVTAVTFPIDFTSNPAEEVGYDNFCFSKGECPPGCVTFTDEIVNCSTNGVFTYTALVTNMSDDIIRYLVFLELPPGVTVNGGPVYKLPARLSPGDSAVVSFTFSGVTTNRLCFKMGAHNPEFTLCCVVDHCIEVPKCCAIVSNECIRCNDNGTFTYTLTYQNLSTNSVTHLFFTPDSDCYTTSPTVLLPPLAPGASTNLTITISTVGTNCPRELCLLVSAYDKDFEECCAFMHCVTLPQCCKGRTYTTNSDFDEGTYLNVGHFVNDQLQFAGVTTPFPYVNIPASGLGTAVKIEVNTGAVVGEYLTAPDGMQKDPSRTTVDKFGSVWVSNRAESGGGQGSIVRIALIIGGTRVDAAGTPNPLGQYLKPPFIYNSGAIDRDGDGLIKTSRGLGDVLPWPNTGGVDSNGGVTTAEDEAIMNYTRVNGTGTRAVAIDANNDVWVGGLNNRAHEKVDGVTGLPILGTQFNVGLGGYGGLIDQTGKLWSAGGLINYVPDFGPSTYIQPVTGGSYGLGIDPCSGNIWVTDGWTNNNYALFELDTNGNVVNWYPQPFWSQGVCVDATGDVWMTEGMGSRVWHLKKTGPNHTPLGFVTGFSRVTGLAVDSNGKIWAAEYGGDRASRIDPALAGGVGAIDLTVNLRPGSTPYNYSDMTGFQVISTSPSGFWDVVHDGGSPGIDWGTVRWTSLEPAGTGIKVEVRASDVQALLPTVAFREVTNNVTFCGTGIRGRFLEVRVTFTRRACSEITPILYDLTIDCCEKDPCGPKENTPPKLNCPEPVAICKGESPTITLNANVFDADGDPLTVMWGVDGVPQQTNSVPAGGPPTSANVTFTYTYPPGSHVVTIIVSDGKDRVRCETKVSVEDQEPPHIVQPQGVVVAGFAGVVPDFVKGAVVSDDCTQAADIRVTQSPVAGTRVGPGVTQVRLTATDASGRTGTADTFYSVTPVVSITAPAKYTDFLPGAPINIEAVAQPGVATIQTIVFLDGDKEIGTDSEPPYRVSYRNAPLGSRRLIARAIDSTGLTSDSEPVVVFVRSAAGEGEGPRITSPSIQQGNIVFSVQTETGKTYEVQSSATPTADSFTRLKIIVGDGAVHSVSDPLAPTARYYRIKVQ